MSNRAMNRVTASLFLFLASYACARAQTNIPIYVNLGMHSEQDVPYQSSVLTFRLNRDALVSFAKMLQSNSVMFNFMSDWTFLAGVTNFDKGLMTTNTANTNVIAWMKSIGFEIDPHCHISQSIFNYADVAALDSLCGVVPSGVVGGYIETPVTNSQWGLVQHPITGAVYTGYVWTPQILWGGGNGDHTYEDNLWFSGIWRPRDATNWWTHSEASPLPNVGDYGNLAVIWTNLDQLIAMRAAGQLCTGRIYNCLIMSNMKNLTNAGYQADYDAQIQAHKTNANIHWVGVSQLYGIWQTNFASRPNMLPYYMTNDFDSDGMNDGWEVTNFCGLTDSDGTNDTDSDAVPDANEYIANTSPTNSGDVFVFTASSLDLTGTNAIVTWRSSTGRVYNIDAASSPTGTWNNVATRSGVSPQMAYTNATTNQSLYRVRVGF